MSCTGWSRVCTPGARREGPGPPLLSGGGHRGDGQGPPKGTIILRPGHPARCIERQETARPEKGAPHRPQVPPPPREELTASRQLTGPSGRSLSGHSLPYKGSNTHTRSHTGTVLNTELKWRSIADHTGVTPRPYHADWLWVRPEGVVAARRTAWKRRENPMGFVVTPCALPVLACVPEPTRGPHDARFLKSESDQRNNMPLKWLPPQEVTPCGGSKRQRVAGGRPAGHLHQEGHHEPLWL